MKVTSIELEDIPLYKAEFNALLHDPHAWDAVFNDVNGKIEPILKGVKALELAASVQQAYLVITYGLNRNEVEFKDVRLSKVRLHLRGGKADEAVVMSLKLRGPATLDENFGELMDKLGDSVEVELRFEPPGQQQDLPLNSVGANERGSSSVESPARERAKAHEREAQISNDMEAEGLKPAKHRGRKPSAGATIN